MSTDFIPRSDADLLIWAKENSALITAAPTTYSLTASIATTYAGLVTAFETKLLAGRGENRGRVDVIEKDEARAALVAYARSWARTVQGSMSCTRAQRAALGLNLRDNPGTPVHAPVEPPVVMVKRAIGRSFEIELRRTGTTKRSKAGGAAGASIFTFVGPEASTDPEAYVFQGNVSRTNFTLEMPASVPAGACVWITAAWYTARGLTSPGSAPISAFVAGGMAPAAASQQQPTMASDTPLLKAA